MQQQPFSYDYFLFIHVLFLFFSHLYFIEVEKRGEITHTYVIQFLHTNASELISFRNIFSEEIQKVFI